jgi:hypothetical protein
MYEWVKGHADDLKRGLKHEERLNVISEKTV